MLLPAGLGSAFGRVRREFSLMFVAALVWDTTLSARHGFVLNNHALDVETKIERN
jgi:hypothetical protein